MYTGLSVQAGTGAPAVSLRSVTPNMARSRCSQSMFVSIRDGVCGLRRTKSTRRWALVGKSACVVRRGYKQSRDGFASHCGRVLRLFDWRLRIDVGVGGMYCRAVGAATSCTSWIEREQGPLCEPMGTLTPPLGPMLMSNHVDRV